MSTPIQYITYNGEGYAKLPDLVSALREAITFNPDYAGFITFVIRQLEEGRERSLEGK